MRDHKPVLQDPIISQREPFQLYLLVFGIIIGGLVLRDVSVSSTLDGAEEMSAGTVRLWALFVFLGSLLAMIGCFWPRKTFKGLFFGLHLERLGLSLLGGACLVFALLVLSTGGDQGVLVAGQNFAFTAACVTRVIYIARRFGWYKRQDQKPGTQEGD